MNIYEEVETLRGARIKRVKPSVFYWSALSALLLGIYLVSEAKVLGGFFVLTAFPFLMLYPAVRFLLGGKDSVVSVVTTAVIEEVLKNEVRKIGDKSNRR